jgi:aspartate carbamoyltransferase regulatory subunit
MQIDSIQNGIVIDHIRAGYGMKVLEYLNIDTESNTVAVIMNAVSQKHGRKDIVKIENISEADIENIDFRALGLFSHNATVSIIVGHKLKEKRNFALPERVKNIIKCKNPRCVTSIEAVSHIFHKAGDSAYRCEYCDNLVKVKEL